MIKFRNQFYETLRVSRMVCILILLFPNITMADGYLNFEVLGRTLPIMTDSNGYQSGIDPDTGKIKKEISVSEVSIENDFATIQISDPSPGEYSVDLNYGGFRDNIELYIEYVDVENNIAVSIREYALLNDSSIHFSMKVDPKSPYGLKLFDIPASPKYVRVGKSEKGTTELRWTNEEYPLSRVYARKAKNYFFELIAEIADVKFDTQHALQNDGEDALVYAVVSVNEVGREGFYNSTVSNRIKTKANFIAEQRVGFAPFEVKFFDLSEGDPSNFAWSLDGDPLIDSENQHPIFAYNEPGVYDIALEVSGPYGRSRKELKNYITVKQNHPPVADAGPDQVIEALSRQSNSIHLDGSLSSDPDGHQIEYSWSGEVINSTLVSPVVSLPLGAHNILLKVTDELGLASSDTVSILIQDTTAPTIDARFVPFRGDRQKFTIVFSADDTVDPLVKLAGELLIGDSVVPIISGQRIQYEKHEEIKYSIEDKIIEIKAPELLLRVVAADFSGNSSETVVQP